MSFSQRLREAIKHLGWNALDLCVATGLAESTVSHLINAVTVPKLVTALTISEVTGWTIDSLNGDQPLGNPDFERLASPVHLIATEFGTSVKVLCDWLTAKVVAEKVGHHTPTVRKYYLYGVEPDLRTASRYAAGCGQTLQNMALGRPVLEEAA